MDTLRNISGGTVLPSFSCSATNLQNHFRWHFIIGNIIDTISKNSHKALMDNLILSYVVLLKTFHGKNNSLLTLTFYYVIINLCLLFVVFAVNLNLFLMCNPSYPMAFVTYWQELTLCDKVLLTILCEILHLCGLRRSPRTLIPISATRNL